jgi:hypothetical protein
MTILLLILIIVFVLSLGCGAVVWFVFRHGITAEYKQPSEPASVVAPPVFRWRYIILPLTILLLSIVLVIYFYRLLPADIAYHFASDGSPDSWISREMAVLWALLPQFFLALLAVAVTWGTTKINIIVKQTVAVGINLQTLLALMGNMVTLPQIIICFAMLDIFSYNAYQIRLMPLWAFTLIVMGLGAIVLGIFFVRVVRQVWGPSR